MSGFLTVIPMEGDFNWVPKFDLKAVLEIDTSDPENQMEVEVYVEDMPRRIRMSAQQWYSSDGEFTIVMTGFGLVQSLQIFRAAVKAAQRMEMGL